MKNVFFTAPRNRRYVLVIVFYSVVTTFFGQLTDQGIAVMAITEENVWDKKAIETTVFQNGDKLNVAEDDWQWINFCSKRKPTVWIKTEDGDKKAYYYNYYAISDTRSLVPEKSFIPTVDLIRNDTLPGFPNKTFTKGYLEQDTENEMVPTVATPDDQYYWTKTKHESAAEGEEVAYIFKFSSKTGLLSASTGQFCDGYPVIAYSQTKGKNFSYKALLPSEFNVLKNELIDHLMLEPGYYDRLNYDFKAVLKFDSQGFNKSQEFSLQVPNDDLNKKNQISSLYILNESLTNYYKYPKHNGSPIACGDSITIAIHSIWTNPEVTTKRDSLPSEMLPENFRSNFLKASKVGDVIQVERSIAAAADGEIEHYKQLILLGFKMRGPSSVLLSPLGLGLKSVTKSYSNDYRRGASRFGVVLAIVTPLLIPFTLASISNMKYGDTKRNTSGITEQVRAGYEQDYQSWKKLTTVGVSMYTLSLTANICGSLILGSKNKKLQKRLRNYMDESYPYGIVIGYENN